MCSSFLCSIKQIGQGLSKGKTGSVEPEKEREGKWKDQKKAGLYYECQRRNAGSGHVFLHDFILAVQLNIKKQPR